MKVLIICEDHSTFEFLSVFKYPYDDFSCDDDKKYQIRISHGTVFNHSKQDYAIYKCESAVLRDRVHARLNKAFESLVAKNVSYTTMGCIVLKGIIQEVKK